jgi:serine/threonine protein kinase
VRPSSKSIAFCCPNLKPQQDCQVCLLADFGISQKTNQKSDFPLIDGDGRYLAPELKSFAPVDNSESLKKADIYAAGLIFMQLALSKLKFMQTN